MPVLYNFSKIHDDPSGPNSVQNAKYRMIAMHNTAINTLSAALCLVCTNSFMYMVYHAVLSLPEILQCYKYSFTNINITTISIVTVQKNINVMKK